MGFVKGFLKDFEKETKMGSLLQTGWRSVWVKV